MRKLVAFIVAVLIAAPAALPASAATTQFRIPFGFRSVGWERLGTGLDHITVKRKTPADSQSIHVARVRKDAPFALRAVVSRQSINSGLEPTSSMCKRTKCVAAINGDFFSAGQPVGGLAILGQALRSPLGSRPQLLLGGPKRVSVGNELWNGQVQLSNGRGITLDGVNVPLRGGKISLFTAAYGKFTGNRNGVTELGVRIIKPKGPIVLGRPATIRILTTRHVGNAPIPADGAVLAGEGAGGQALDAIWWMMKNKRVGYDATITIHSTNPASESIGGAPVLLKDGRRAFTIVPRGLVQGRHPRTVVGWNKTGELFLVTIDGRQPGVAEGMTLVETAELLRKMGATDAINLDGGGSTTFVTRGRIRNAPSDVVVVRKRRRATAQAAIAGDRVIARPERAVATALVLVPVAVKPAKPAPRPSANTQAGAYGNRFLPVADDPAPLALGSFASSPLPAPPRSKLTMIALALALAVSTLVIPARRASRKSKRVRQRS